MDVATRIIKKLGGAYKVADLLGCHHSRVYRWTYPPERGGTGGSIPANQFRKLLAVAPDKVKPSDFFPVLQKSKPKRRRVA